MLIVKYKFDNTSCDLLPTFNIPYTYTYTDIIEDNITIRTIESDTLPTRIRLGAMSDSLCLLEVIEMNASKVIDVVNMFFNCKKLTSINLSNINTSSVTDMSGMFENCYELTSLDVSNFDTKNVTNMDSMFKGCNKLTSLELSNFDTKNVTNMSYMFNDCNKLTSLELSNFDTSKVTNMNSMFNGCNKLTDIGLLYSSVETVEKLQPNLPFTQTNPGTLWLNQIPASCVDTASIKYRTFECKTTDIYLDKPLSEGDKLYWDTDKLKYLIEHEDGSIEQTDIIKQIALPTFKNSVGINCIGGIQSGNIKITVPFMEVEDDYVYDDSHYVEYLQNSFELRYPDEDDVGKDYGYLNLKGDATKGLKRVIEWVDNAPEEEFKADFDKYFNKHYTLRYYLLVVLIGAIDNLGRQSCRV